MMETETERFERHTRVNQLGCFLGMKTVVPLMEQSGGGSIVNISSVTGLRRSLGLPAVPSPAHGPLSYAAGAHHRPWATAGRLGFSLQQSRMKGGYDYFPPSTANT